MLHSLASDRLRKEAARLGFLLVVSSRGIYSAVVL